MSIRVLGEMTVAHFCLFFFWDFDVHVETKKQRNIGGGPLDGGKSTPVSIGRFFVAKKFGSNCVDVRICSHSK